MNKIEKKTLEKTLELNDAMLIKIFKRFKMYNSPSTALYIYDLSDVDDCNKLLAIIPQSKVSELIKIATDGIVAVTWFEDTQNFDVFDSRVIKKAIELNWEKMFESIMLDPSFYAIEYKDVTYFDDVFFPIIIKEVGYDINLSTWVITRVNKN